MLRSVFLLVAFAGCALQYGGNDESRPFRPDSGADTTVEVTPILHYRFDESLANDGSLGRAFDGTGANITYVEGVAGKAVAFDTTWTTQVLLPTQEELSKPRDYTVELWFREDSVYDINGVTRYLFDNRGAGGFQTYHGANSQSLTTCSSAGCATIGYSVRKWHQLTYRHPRGGQLEIYIDEVLATSLPASDAYFSSTQTAITLGTRTNMQIDELKIFDRVFPIGS